METYDVIIIGADHNGLTCAAYLLKAGYSVLLLEQRSIPGGAATTLGIPEGLRIAANLRQIQVNQPELRLFYKQPSIVDRVSSHTKSRCNRRSSTSSRGAISPESTGGSSRCSQ